VQAAPVLHAASTGRIKIPGIISQHPDTKYKGSYHARRHNAEKQFALHHFKAFVADSSDSAHDKHTIEADKTGLQTSDHKNQVQSF